VRLQRTSPYSSTSRSRALPLPELEAEELNVFLPSPVSQRPRQAGVTVTSGRPAPFVAERGYRLRHDATARRQDPVRISFGPRSPAFVVGTRIERPEEANP
jgi:hypothetical protein